MRADSTSESAAESSGDEAVAPPLAPSARAADAPPRLGEANEHGPTWNAAQFQLRSLLLLMAVIAAPMAWWGWHAMNTRRQQAVMEELSKFGAQAGWLRGNVVQITFRGESYQAKAMSLLRSLPKLQRVVFMDTAVQLPDFAGLASLPLDQIKILRVTEARPKKVDGEIKLPASLTSLWLEEAGVSDETLTQLPDLHQLESLSLIGNPITDKSVDLLCKRGSVMQLFLQRTSLSKAGVDKLRRELPKAIIEF